jgi:PAS domain S-box-containing protein
MAELRFASDRSYKKLVEGIDHAVAWTADRNLTLTFISRRAIPILGHSAEGFLLPDFWRTFLYPEDRDMALAQFRHALSISSADLAFDHRLLAADGRVIWLHTGLSRTEDEIGRPELHGISIDVTGIKRAEITQALLADAGCILSKSLDYRAGLRDLARRLVRDRADWCLIDELTPEGTLTELGAEHSDPAQQHLLRALDRRRTVDRSAAAGISRVAVAQVPEALQRYFQSRMASRSDRDAARRDA